MSLGVCCALLTLLVELLKLVKACSDEFIEYIAVLVAGYFIITSLGAMTVFLWV